MYILYILETLTGIKKKENSRIVGEGVKRKRVKI